MIPKKEVEGKKSSTISLAFKFFNYLIRENNPEYEFSTHSLDLEFLERENVLNVEERLRNKRLLMKELQRESLISETPGRNTSYIKSAIQKEKNLLPQGVESFHQLRSIEEKLEENIANETIAEAEKRRAKEEAEVKKALDDITKE